MSATPKSFLSRQTLYISDIIIHLQSSLNEVNQVLFALGRVCAGLRLECGSPQCVLQQHELGRRHRKTKFMFIV